jgi:hypothetical protein
LANPPKAIREGVFHSERIAVSLVKIEHMNTRNCLFFSAAFILQVAHQGDTPAAARRRRAALVPRTPAPRLQPGERKFLDYALPPLHIPMDVVTNTGGRVGWHNSPLPGRLFPGNAPW